MEIQLSVSINEVAKKQVLIHGVVLYEKTGLLAF